VKYLQYLPNFENIGPAVENTVENISVNFTIMVDESILCLV